MKLQCDDKHESCSNDEALCRYEEASSSAGSSQVFMDQAPVTAPASSKLSVFLLDAEECLALELGASI